MLPKPRIGVYICHCGTNIAATVDVEAVTEFAATLPGVAVARNYTYMCSEPGQALIKEDARTLGLNRVVVASCSPRMHEPTFRAASQEGGVNPYQFEMANIREQCSWVHHDRHEATEKAKALVYAAVMKAARLEPLEEREAPVTPAALVIGGGVAGMVAALDIADAGFPVHLVEQSDRLGGRVAELNRTFPDLEPVSEWLPALVDRVQRHPNITVYLNSRVAGITGFVGNFEATVEPVGAGLAPGGRPQGSPLQVGAIVIATGYNVFDPHLKPEFGYGLYPQVGTTLELEHRLGARRPAGEERAGEDAVRARGGLGGAPQCVLLGADQTAEAGAGGAAQLLTPRADTLDEHHILRRLPVHHQVAGRQPVFQFQRGDHLRVQPVPELRLEVRIKDTVAGGDGNGPDP